MLSVDRLRDVLRYDPDTGVFTWLVSRRGRFGIKPGSRAGAIIHKNYRSVCVDGVPYLEHRLAWFYMTGKWPSDEIDHKNGNQSDNRFSNLRDANHEFNSQNQRKARINNKTGLLGVFQNGNKFCAQIVTHGEKKHLGSYATPEDAHSAYLMAKRMLHESCTI